MARACQFASEPAFWQTVTVRERDVNRYGRLVPEVILPNSRNPKHELVQAGMAW